MTRWFARFAIVVALVNSGQSIAFKTGGHDLIESTAYSRAPAAARRLVDAGLLKANAEGLPQVLNANADWSLERQFDQDLQCYHFMASNGAVRAAIDSGPEKAQATLLAAALPDCLQILRAMFMDAVRLAYTKRSDAEAQSGRGLYVVMHAVIDSYSEEHTWRNTAMELATVKGWAASAWWRLWDPTGVASVPVGRSCHNESEPVLRLLHTSAGDADYDFVAGEARSDESDLERALRSCINTRGLVERATQAVVDLLTAAAAASDSKGHWNEETAARAWSGFVSRNLAPVGYRYDPKPTHSFQWPACSASVLR
jgi:hypothetical protein